MKRCVIIVLMLVLGTVAAFAQKTAKEKSNEEASYVLVDLSYMNDAIFMGRKDSIAAPYLLPSIGYYDKSGLFADVTASYLTSSGNQRVDLFYVTGGYLFEAKKWSGGLSGTAYFYNQPTSFEVDYNGKVLSFTMGKLKKDAQWTLSFFMTSMTLGH